MLSPAPLAARSASLARTIRRVHRRMLWLRLAEGAGVGALIGSVAALIFVALLYWHGTTDVLLPILASMLLGAIGGLGNAWKRRPTRLQAAMVADRQLNLSDLLATALLLDHASHDPWSQSILALAEAECDRIQPGALLLHRFGAPHWSAIGLVGTLAVALSFLAGSAAEMRADDAVRQAQASQRDAREMAGDPLRVVSADSSMRRPSAPHEGEDAAQPNPGEAPDSAGPRHTPDSPAAGELPPSPRPGVAPGENDAEGSGSGRTRTPARHVPQSLADTQDGAHPAAQESATSNSAGGGRQVTNGGNGHDELAATGAGRAPRSPPGTPPWRTNGWNEDVAAAERALQTDHVAPVYHEIVRDYFQLQP